MEKKVILLFCFIVAATATNLQANQHSTIITNSEAPCIGIELGSTTHRLVQTHPVLFSVNSYINATQQYENIFSTTKNEHKENFACLKEVVVNLNSATEDGFREIKKAVELRDETEGERQKRSPTALVAAAITSAITSLLATLASSIYFGMTLARLGIVIDGIQRQVEADATYAKSIAGNVRIVANHSNTVGVVTNLVTTSFEKFRHVSYFV